jgi:hypothetical protein
MSSAEADVAIDELDPVSTDEAASLVDALVGDTEENAGDESSTAEKERDDLKEKVAKLQRETSELEALLEQEKGKRQEADKERDQLKAVVQQLMHASKSATSPKKGAPALPSPKKGAPAETEEVEEDVDPQATHQAQMDAKTALRMAAMSGDTDKLKEAIKQAEELGLDFEAGQGKRRLAKLEA